MAKKNEIEAVNLISKIMNLTKMNKGIEALELLNLLDNNYSTTRNYYLNGPGCFIEVGFDLKKIEYIMKGIDIGENTLKTIKDDEHRSLLCYNLGNGYFDIYSVEKSDTEIYNDKFLQKAKYYYRQVSNENIDLYCQASVNLANVYKKLGRIVEAIHIYERILEINPSFSMAKLNLGDSLIVFADICDKYRGATYKEAYHLLEEGLSDLNEVQRVGGIDAINYFQYEKLKIEAMFKDKKYLKNKILHPEIDFKKVTKFEKEYYIFCFKNKLFLNFHIHKSNIVCNSAIIDSVNITLVERIKEKSQFFYYTQYINQIKEDFSTARYMLFQSQHKQKYLNRISSLTKYADTLDYSDNNIYIGLLKNAFSESYNILDKIAIFLNSYLKLNLKKRDVYFNRIWVVKKEENVIPRKEIADTKNISLFGIYDVFVDFSNNSNKLIKDIRNASTHDKLIVYDDFFEKIRDNNIDPDGLSISYNSLMENTIELMLIVKSCIMNLINFVNNEELKKKNKSDLIMPMYYYDKEQNFYY